MAEHGICVSSALMGAPGEIQVIPYGITSTPKGDFLFDRIAAELVTADFNTRRNQMVIDYEHQSLGGGEAPAAGWIKSLMFRGDEGLWAEVEWTERAKQYLTGCEYRYLSPVFIRRESDKRVVRLLNAALTNNPAIDAMVPVTGRGDCDNGSQDEDEQRRKEDGSMRKVLEALGMEGAAEEDEALGAIAVMRRELEELGRSLERVREALGLGPEAQGPELEGTALAMRQASEEAVSLREKLLAREANELVELAMKEGKVSPAQREWAMDYALRDAGSFRVFAARAPRVVPIGGLRSEQRSKSRGTVCPVQEEVNRALGLSSEKFQRYSRKEEE